MHILKIKIKITDLSLEQVRQGVGKLQPLKRSSVHSLKASNK